MYTFEIRYRILQRTRSIQVVHDEHVISLPKAIHAVLNHLDPRGPLAEVEPVMQNIASLLQRKRELGVSWVVSELLCDDQIALQGSSSELTSNGAASLQHEERLASSREMSVRLASDHELLQTSLFQEW